MGAMTDTATLEKGTLVVRKRSVKQGPVTIDLAVDGSKASGSMNMNGKETPISADLGGPLFAETGGPQCLALLPLGRRLHHDVPQFRSAEAEAKS